MIIASKNPANLGLAGHYQRSKGQYKEVLYEPFNNLLSANAIRRLTGHSSASMFAATKAKAAVSMMKKIMPGLSTRSIGWRLKPRPNRVVFLFPHPISFGVRLWVRAFGAASAGRLHSGGVDNLVRPAHHFINMASRVHMNRMEATL